MLILGVSLLTPSSDLIAGVTGKINIVNEAIDISSARIPVGVNDSGNINTSVTFTVTNFPSSWKVQDCPISGVVYGNSSTDYTVTTDYTFAASTGVLTLVNSTAVVNGGNSTLIDYTYCGDNYLNSQWQRSVLNLTPGFWAIALLLVSVGLFFMVARSEGILNM